MEQIGTYGLLDRLRALQSAKNSLKSVRIRVGGCFSARCAATVDVTTLMTMQPNDARVCTRPHTRQVHSFPIRLVQHQSDADHYAGLDRALGERGIAADRVYPDQPPPEMGNLTKAVVISDPFAAMNMLAARQARTVGARVVLMMDGIVEYRNTFLNPRVKVTLAACDHSASRFLRPAPADVVACCGEIDRRVLNALGNEAVATGLPRITSMDSVALPPPRRAVMVASANQPWFSSEEKQRVVSSLRNLKAALERLGVHAVWRLRGGLDGEIGVTSDPRPLREVIAEVPAVITTPSTLLVESMIAGRATAIINAHSTPLWQPAAWGWNAGATRLTDPDFSAASELGERARCELATLHREANAMTVWYDEAAALIESLLDRDPAMLERQRECLARLYAPEDHPRRRTPQDALAGLLQTVCAGDFHAVRRGNAASRAIEPFSPVRVPARRRAPVKPCVVSCVMCDDVPLGGVLTWSERLANAFAARDLGYSVRTLLVCTRPDAWRGGNICITPDEHTDLCVIDPTADHTTIVGQVRQSIENLAGGIPALVIPNYTDCTYAAANQLRHRGSKVVAIAHTDEPYYQELINTYRWDAGVGVSAACVSWMKRIEETTRSAGPARRIEPIHYGIPVASSPRTVEAAGPLKIAYIGRMVEPQKRISNLLNVIDGLEARGALYVLHMIGEGVDLPAWRADLAKRSLKHGRVEFHGRRDPQWINSFLPTIDVSVLVSEFEGTSISMLEAMGAGVVPVVTAVRSGAGEWVLDGKTGFTCPVNEPDEMAERLAWLSRNRAELTKLGAAAWAKARAEASIEHMATRYRAVFDAAAAHPADRAPSDLGLRLIERWRWNKTWAENPAASYDYAKTLLTEAGYKAIVNDAPIPGCDAVIVRSDIRPLSRIQAEQIELWRACGLGVVVAPHLVSRGPEDAMAPAESGAGDRVRSIIARAAAEGCNRIAVYGTGKHTRRIASIFDGSLPFVGLIDDQPPPWEYMFGLPIVTIDQAAESLRPDAVLLSSDAWEARMWTKTAELRRAGVRVIPLYGVYPDDISVTIAERATAA